MSLKQQLTDDMKQAMRDRNALKLGAIRFLMSEIKNFEIDHGEQDDAGVEAVIAKQVKQLSEAIVEFEKAGRTDLVEEEQQKVAVMKAYLPEPMTDSELEKIVAETVAAMPGAQMGQVMGAIKAKTMGRADGAKLAQLVKAALA